MTAVSHTRVRRAEGTWNRDESVTELVPHFNLLLPCCACSELEKNLVRALQPKRRSGDGQEAPQGTPLVEALC